MLTLRRALLDFAPAFLALSMILGDVGLAEHNFQHPRIRCSIPAYGYGHDDRQVSNRVVAIADPARQVTWHLPDRPVRQKRFHFPVRVLAADHVRLESVGLALYSDGRLSATGRLVHSGGPQGALLGNRVIIRLQAYAGLPGRRGALADAAVVWQTEKQLWVSRDEPRIISLVGYENLPEPPRFPHGPRQNEYRPQITAWSRLAEQFDEITHLELELAYLGDR